MKNFYKNPETEIVTIGCLKVILDDDTEMSGEIDDPEANRNSIFEEDGIMDVGSKSNLWDK